MNHYVVTVEIIDRYWAIQVFEDAQTADAARASVQAKFDEAVNLHYVQGAFRVTEAQPVASFL